MEYKLGPITSVDFSGILTKYPVPVDSSDEWAFEPKIFGRPAKRVLQLIQLDEYGTQEQKRAYAAGVPLEDIFA